MLTVSHAPLVLRHRFGGVEFSGLPSLALVQNLNIIYNDMEDHKHQEISVDDYN